MSSDALSRFVLRRLDALRLSQTELARRAGIRRQTLSNLINGHRRPTSKTLAGLADALGVSYSHLASLDYGEPTQFRSSAGIAVHGDDKSEFLADVTYPDNSLVTVGQRFQKVWEIRNAGKVYWRERKLVCMDAKDLAVPSPRGRVADLPITLVPEARSVAIPDTAPGEDVQIAATFMAPAYPCTVISWWKMFSATNASCFPNSDGLWCLVTVTAK